MIPEARRPRAERDDEKRRADSTLDWKVREQGECRDEEKAAADADEAREQTDAETDCDGRKGGNHSRTTPRTRGTARVRLLTAPTQHQGGGDDHERSEKGELDDTRYQLRQLRASARANHGHETEEQGHPQIDIAGAPVLQRSHEARGAHHGKAHRDRLFGRVAHRVHEDRHGENGSPTAENAERETDEEGEPVAEHRRESTRLASTAVREDAQRASVRSRIFSGFEYPRARLRPRSAWP